MAALLPLLAGCQNLDAQMDVLAERVEEQQAKMDSRPYIRPGLEPLYAPKAVPAAAETTPQPVPPERELVPFPAGRLAPEQAEVLLAGDPMALRFLALKTLTAQGLVPVEEAVARKQENLGALLPLTAPRPPAAGLDAPIPPLPQVIERFRGLGSGAERGNTTTRVAERDFLTDALLPKAPALRLPYGPPDVASARKLQSRLGRLEDAGLITPDEREGENEAVEQLIAGGTLPLEAPPPPPEETAKPKTAPKAGAGRGNRMPGGVSGKLEVIPSPPGVEAPRLAPGAKGPAGMHLLSMGTAAHGDRAWEALVKEHTELSGLGHTVLRTDLGDLGVTYRLIAGPVDPAQAESLCATLKTRGQACTPTPFPAAPAPASAPATAPMPAAGK